MALGLKGRTAIVCAASKGLGRGCAEKLAEAGVNLTICARTKATLEATADAIGASSSVNVRAIACDITTDAGRAAVLDACPTPDILINNAGGPPPGDFKDFSLDDWRAAVEGNMITPIALIQATVYGMMERNFGRIINITSYSVKFPIAHLELSNGARSGLTGAIAVLARKSAAHNVTINALLPGPFDTERLRGTSTKISAQTGRPFDEVHQERMQDVPAKRFGTAEEFGATAAFLASQYGGNIPGKTLSSTAAAIPERSNPSSRF